MNFLNRINGFDTNAHRNLPAEVRAELHRALAKGREQMRKAAAANELNVPEFTFGIRFYSDAAAMDRIATYAHADEVMANLGGWALDALRDCGQADFWYENHR